MPQDIPGDGNIDQSWADVQRLGYTWRELERLVHDWSGGEILLVAYMSQGIPGDGNLDQSWADVWLLFDVLCPMRVDRHK